MRWRTCAASVALLLAAASAHAAAPGRCLVRDRQVVKVADSWRFPCALDGAAFATFNVVFGSTQNDKYSVKTGWCTSSDPGETKCTWRYSNDFREPLIFTVEDASHTDGGAGVATIEILCGNWMSACEIEVWSLTIAGPEGRTARL